MKISTEDKEFVFSIIKNYFNWDLSESVKSNHFYSDFRDHNLYENGFEFFNGAVKYCICSSLFENFVVKFCTEEFDYCQREYTNYLAAVDQDLEGFFPCTDLLGEYYGITFYIQERAECCEEEISSIWYENLKESYEPWDEDEDEDDMNDHIWDMIYDLEDEERSYMVYNDYRLTNFLTEYCINDLHEGNYGYIDGRLVIIDFSGYGWRARERSF